MIGQGHWNTITISRIIKDEVYIGDMVQGKSTTIQHKQIKADKENWIAVENTHEAIISKEMFQKAQQCRMEIAKKSKSKNKTPYTENILKGKIYCQHCGRNLNRGRKITKTKGEIYYFFCITNWRIKKGNCKGVRINEKKLFQEILFLFCQKRNLFLEKEQFLQQQINHMHNNIALWKQKRSKLEIQMNEKRLYLQTLYENLINRVITQAEYKELRENYQNEIENLLSEICCLEKVEKNSSQKIENILKLKDVFQSTQTSNITKEFADRFIERVEVASSGAVTVIFYFDELLKELEVNIIE